MKPQKHTANTDNRIDVTTITENLTQWLIAHSEGCKYLLAHADDGVIWGRFDTKDGSKTLVTSRDAFPEKHMPILRLSTLQQCRIFGSNTETMVWRDDDGWHARKITDEQSDDEQALDEEQLLWGTHTKGAEKGFLLLVEGNQGIAHAPPITKAPTEKDRAKLRVRHYLTTDKETGMVRIGSSRLVELIAPKGTEA